jgi:hypothetical protein
MEPSRPALVNRKFDSGRGIGAYVRFNQNETAYLIDGRWAKVRTCVVWSRLPTGWVVGKRAEEGRLMILQPGKSGITESRSAFLTSNEEIEQFSQ